MPLTVKLAKPQRRLAGRAVALGLAVAFPAHADLSPQVVAAFEICLADGRDGGSRIADLVGQGWTVLPPDQRQDAVLAFAAPFTLVFLPKGPEFVKGRYDRSVTEQQALAARRDMELGTVLTWLRNDDASMPTFILMSAVSVKAGPTISCGFATFEPYSAGQYAELTGTIAGDTKQNIAGQFHRFKPGTRKFKGTVAVITPDAAAFAAVGVSSVATYMEIPLSSAGPTP
jgi:hypothetical protein